MSYVILGALGINVGMWTRICVDEDCKGPVLVTCMLLDGASVAGTICQAITMWG